MVRTAIIMAGGAGERFWPLSRPDHPKQLLCLTGSGKTMLEEAVNRIAPLVGLEHTFISTVPHLVAPISRSSAGVAEDRIIAEPAKRNTAGALSWSAACLLARYGDQPLSMSIVTADHRIEPDSAFHSTVRSALEVVEGQGGLATIGIVPDRPETGYGYIESGEVDATLGVRVHRVKSFREKPHLEVAKEYVSSGSYLWNSGMFFWTMHSFLEELDAASPEHAAFIRSAAPLLAEGRTEGASELFQSLPNISIDYALMEKARRVYVAEAAFAWDDLGSWDSLHRVRPQDDAGNVTEGKTGLLECVRSVVVNNSSKQGVYAIGLDNLVVVVTDDVVMICPADRAQEVRRLGAIS
ncbi:MAG TPA: mannose-1-phosphate guanylyltransferase [Fimbriimonadaceae bacterium]|nr:mannose-1-phosphate guanylyltransferase [Fimbriimonadaceae bacterium]